MLSDLASKLLILFEKRKKMIFWWISWNWCVEKYIASEPHSKQILRAWFMSLSAYLIWWPEKGRKNWIFFIVNSTFINFIQQLTWDPSWMFPPWQWLCSEWCSRNTWQKEIYYDNAYVTLWDPVCMKFLYYLWSSPHDWRTMVHLNEAATFFFIFITYLRV